jgi:twitching motility protein PilT
MKKELLDEFVAARWKSSEEVREFIKAVGAITADDVVAMLDYLTSKRSVQGSSEHGSRIRAFAELSATVNDKRLFEPYLRALKVDDKHLRNALVNLFPNVDFPSLHQNLCELLRSPDSNLRRAVSQIFQKIGDRVVLRILSPMFSERNFAGRNEAVDIAGAFPSHYAVEFFKIVFENGLPPEKARALKYLGSPSFVKSNPRAIVTVIQPLFKDPNDMVIVEAIASFSKVCTEEEYFNYAGMYLYDANLKLVKAAVDGLRYFLSGRAMATLERKLHTGPTFIRLAVLDTIEAIGTPEIYKPLMKGLEHRQSEVRERASAVLARLTKAGKVQVADTIIWLLRSSDPKVRNMAVDVVASMPEKKQELWADVLDRLRKEDWWVRQRIANVLVEMAGKELIQYITAYLSDPADTIRRLGLDVLIHLKAADVLDLLIRTASQDENWWVREKAIQAIGEIKDARTIPYLLDVAIKEPDFQVVVLEALRTMEAVSSASQIVPFLSSENTDVRLAALRCLDRFNDTKYGESILALTKDADIKVSLSAREIAGKWNIDYSEFVSKAEASLSFLDRLLISIHKLEGDDLILLPGQTPYMKKHGKIVPLSQSLLSVQQLQTLARPLLTTQQFQDIQNLRDVDLSYEVRSEGLRFRTNLFVSRTGISMVFRIIKGDMWKLEDLGLPPLVRTFGDFKNGLVLVGGPTGSGKSTTLAAIIDYINRTSKRHVISIEDPIEVIHRSEMGLVNQREVGVHTPSFTQALRMTLREDPDVILVGEMRDLPTIQFAVTAAETGHLVFGTVHTVSADTSIDRLINAYPPETQEQVRSMLADSLRSVLCQYLIRHKVKSKRVLAYEIMLNNHAIANLIRKGKTFQIPSVIAISKELEMKSMDNSLMDLFKQGEISAEEAYLKANNKADFEEIVGIKKEKQAAGAANATAPSIKEQGR